MNRCHFRVSSTHWTLLKGSGSLKVVEPQPEESISKKAFVLPSLDVHEVPFP